MRHGGTRKYASCWSGAHTLQDVIEQRHALTVPRESASIPTRVTAPTRSLYLRSRLISHCCSVVFYSCWRTPSPSNPQSLSLEGTSLRLSTYRIQGEQCRSANPDASLYIVTSASSK